MSMLFIKNGDSDSKTKSHEKTQKIKKVKEDVKEKIKIVLV
jgi:hypothetical protein